MGKKNDNRLCWNCHGNVSQTLTHCPYCGMELQHAEEVSREASLDLKNSPFEKNIYQEEMSSKPPYAMTREFAVTEEEWKEAIEEEKPLEEEHEEGARSEMGAFLLLLPGVVFFLFGVALLLFSKDGILSFTWNSHFAYFYFLGAAPLLFFGWKALR